MHLGTSGASQWVNGTGFKKGGRERGGSIELDVWETCFMHQGKGSSSSKPSFETPGKWVNRIDGGGLDVTRSVGNCLLFMH